MPVCLGSKSSFRENNLKSSFSENNLNILAYNITGLKGKIIFPNFINLISSSDIFFLFETFVTEENIINYKKYFTNHKLYWIPAKRRYVTGRASGGSVYGISLNNVVLKNSKFVKEDENVFLHLNIPNKNLYIFPAYLNFNSWDTEFNVLSNSIRNTGKTDIMVIGDLNARIGAVQGVTGRAYFGMVSRRTKDENLNKKGERLLEFLEDYDMVVVNGRSSSDINGEFTFIGKQGCSTIDLCCISGEWNEIVTDFEVCKSALAEHMPIQVTISFSSPSLTGRSLNLLPRLRWQKEKMGSYKTNLDSLVRRIKTFSANELIEELVSSIRKVAPARSKSQETVKATHKWFDIACEELRKRSLRLLNCARKNPSEEAKHDYLEASKKYKNTCWKKKTEHYQKVAYELSQVRDSKQFWKAARELRGDTFFCGKNLQVQEFAAYFKELLNPPTIALTPHYAEPFSVNPVLDAPISYEELSAVLKKCKDKKAPGPDMVPYEFLKNAPKSFLDKLTQAYNVIFETENVPDSFAKSILFPLHKKGDIEVVSNYRAIAFMNTVVKIFAGILLQRLTGWCNIYYKLSEAQAGFRKGYSTVDSIFVLKNIIKLNMQRGKKVYALFIDFKSAFDLVNRNALFYKLSQMGLSTKFLAVLKSLYKETKSAVWDGVTLSTWFETKMGVKQGCLLSPLLFALFLNDIEDCVIGGIPINDLKIKMLLYADDIVVLSLTPERLQQSINRIKEYCVLWNLTVNLQKSKIMVFRNGGRLARGEKWYFGSERIEVVDEYKYLGVVLTPRLTMIKHLKERLAQGKKAVNSTWNALIRKKEVAISVKYKVFEAVMRAIVCYAAQVWGHESFDDLEKIQRFFLKRLFRLPNGTPNYMLHLETGLAPLFIHTLKLHLEYLYKVLNKYEDQRYPLKVAKVILERKELFVKDWESLASSCNFPVEKLHDFKSMQKSDIDDFVRLVDCNYWNEYIEQARSSQHRSLYRELSYSFGPGNNYFKDDNSIEKISLLFRSRGELVVLNFTPHRSSSTEICTLCNLNTKEDIFHFIAICPILKEFRLRYLKKPTFNRDEAKEILNGRNWEDLYRYMTTALSYRERIVRESF